MSSLSKFLIAALLAAPAYAWADPGSMLIVMGQIIVTKVAAYAFVGWVMIAAGIVYGSVSKRRKASRASAEARDAYNANLEDRGATILSGVPPWRIVYGRATVGGSIHAMFTADKVFEEDGRTVTRKDAMHYLVYVFAAHEVETLHDVFIDGRSAGPFDTAGWSWNSEYVDRKAQMEARSAVILAGQSITEANPIIMLRALQHPVDWVAGEIPAEVTVSNEGRTITAGVDTAVTYYINPPARSTFRFIFHKGSPDQAVDPLLHSLFPGKWTVNHRLRGRAYAVVAVDIEDAKFQGGPPTVTVDITGKKVYDPRTATTAGSSNPALCIRDYLLSPWGAAASASIVDDAYVVAAANACDVPATFPAPAYTDSEKFDFNAGHEDWGGGHVLVTHFPGSPSYIRVEQIDHGYNAKLVREWFNFSGASNRYLRVRIRRHSGDGWYGRVYYATDAHDFSDNYRKDLPTGLLVANGWTTLVFDMHSLTFGHDDWKISTIKKIRFDFGINAGDVFDIDWIAVSSFTPTTTSEPKYTLNGSFTTDDSRESVIDGMASSMNGFVTNCGSWLVVAGSWTPPIRSFNDNDLDGQIAIIQGDAGLDEVVNGCKGVYYPQGTSSPVEFKPYTNTTLVTADGEELWEDIALPYTNSEARARNVARVRVERTRNGQIISIPLKLHAWPVQVGDRIQQTSSEYGFTDKVYRVTDWGFSVTGAVVLTAQEDTEGTWDETDTTLGDPTPNTDLPNPNTVQSVENLTAASGTVHLAVASDGTVVTRVQISWDEPRDAYLVSGSAYVELIWRRTFVDPEHQWHSFRVPATAVSAYVENAIEHDWLVIGARYVNNLGRESAWTYIDHIVIGKSQPPADAVGLAYANVVGGMRVTWTAATEPDYLETEIRRGVDWETGTLVWVGRANETLWVPPTNDTYNLWVVHRDTTGNESTPVLLETTYVAVEVGGSQYSTYLFTRSDGAPATPTGDDPTEDVPQVWFDAPPAANGNPLWVSIGTKTASGVLIGVWSDPVQLEGSSVSVQYSVNGVDGWHSTFAGGDLYARYSTDGGITWSLAIKIVGEDGVSGGYTEILFKRAPLASPPSAPIVASPGDWFDAPPAETGDPLWVTVARKNADGSLVGVWSDPVQIDGNSLMVEYSVDGVSDWSDTFAPGHLFARYSTDRGISWTDGIRIVAESGLTGTFIFRRAASAPDTPVGDTPAGWFDAPPAANGNPLWVSTGTRTLEGALVGVWSDPIRIEGAGITVQYSVNGVDGWHATFVTGDIYARYSTDEGGSWSSSVKIVGEDAKALSLTATGFAFIGADAAAATVAGPDITFTANLQNLTGTADFTATRYNAAGDSLGTFILGGAGNSRTMTAAQFTNSGAAATWRVVVAATHAASGLSDTMTVYRGNDGANGVDTVQARLSNEAHTLSADNGGGSVNYAGSGSLIQVFEGITELQFVASSPAAGQWTATRGQLSGTISPGAISLDPVGLKAGIMAQHSGMTTDVAVVRVTVTGKTADGTSFPAILLDQTLTKSKTGVDGEDGAPGGSIEVYANNGTVFTTSGSGTNYTPSSIVVARRLINVTDPSAAGTVWTLVNGTHTGSLTVLNTSTGAIPSIEPSEISDSVTLRCTVTDSVTGLSYSDDITITKSRDPVSGYLTNDAVTLPASAAGAVSSYTGASGTFKLVNSAGEVTATGSNPVFSIAGHSGFGTTYPTNTGISISSTGAFSVTSNVSSGSGNATVTFQAVYTDTLGGTKTIQRVFTISKALGGADGATGDKAAKAYRVISSTTLPSAPTITQGTVPTAGAAVTGTSWYLAPKATLADNEWMFEVDGTVTTGGAYTWTTQSYMSTFKVGSLSALSANIGTVTSGTVTGATIQTASSGARIVLTGSTLTALNSSSAELIKFSNAGDARFTGGTSESAIGIGGIVAAASAKAGTATNSSTTVGMYASAAGTLERYGLIGETSSPYGAGVWGYANQAGAYGVRAENAAGYALQVAGTSRFTGAITSTLASGNAITVARPIVSTLLTGTAPFTVSSSTRVNNLNAQYLDGKGWANPNAIGSTTPTSGVFTTLALTSTFAARGNSSEGGHLVLGYRYNTTVNGEGNSTWNIDVDSSNDLRIFRLNSSAVSIEAVKIDEGTGEVALKSLRINTAPNTTTGGGALTVANLPTGTTAKTLQWVEVNINGTAYWMACIPK